MIKRILNCSIDECITRLRAYNDYKTSEGDQRIAVSVIICHMNLPIDCSFQLKIEDSRFFINRQPQILLKGHVAGLSDDTALVAKFAYSIWGYLQFLLLCLIPVIAFFANHNSLKSAFSALTVVILFIIVYEHYSKQHRKILKQAIDSIFEECIVNKTVNR